MPRKTIKDLENVIGWHVAELATVRELNDELRKSLYATREGLEYTARSRETVISDLRTEVTRFETESTERKRIVGHVVSMFLGEN